MIHFPSCIKQELPEKPEKVKKGSVGSRRERDVEEEDEEKRGKDDGMPPPPLTAIAWSNEKYFGTPLQVKKVGSKILHL